MKTLFSFALLLFTTTGICAPADPKSVVEDIFAKAASPEISLDGAKQAEVNQLVDFESLAKAALGAEYKKIDAKEFAWFRDTLQEIITRTVYPKAPDFLKGVHITYNSVSEKEAAAIVKSTVQNKADLTDVDYRFKQAQSGDWHVVDVAIAGQSWVDSIQDQVASVIKKKKWAGLKESMSRRLRELKSGKA